ncbi:hypothetical protein NC651_028022 [Populus alba x Populus x berolinensis]|nr:hypothetical protein NC651_028022 [Populus alba x Populus x berolinensis]
MMKPTSFYLVVDAIQDLDSAQVSSCDSDTTTLLEKLGCNVATVASGFESLSALGQAASSFKILILNIQKPELDRYEVAMRIWKLRSRVFPLIIAMIATYDDDVSD